jgi:hypothetical protein
MGYEPEGLPMTKEPEIGAALTPCSRSEELDYKPHLFCGLRGHILSISGCDNLPGSDEMEQSV